MSGASRVSTRLGRIEPLLAQMREVLVEKAVDRAEDLQMVTRRAL